MARFTPLKIEGAWLIEHNVFHDDRGEFREWFRFEQFERETGTDFNPVQANLSRSAKGVIRGIHFSLAEGGQSKLVTCASGKILDVIVDIRPKSSTFMSWESIELDADSGRAVYISENLGHGFQALESDSIVTYLLSSEYSPEKEFGINPLDAELNILWRVKDMKLSERDSQSPSLRELLNYQSKTIN